MKAKRSIGIKRMAIVATFILPVFLFLTAIVAGFFHEDLAITIAFCSLFSIGVPIAVYKVGYWIADGFHQDKE